MIYIYRHTLYQFCSTYSFVEVYTSVHCSILLKDIGTVPKIRHDNFHTVAVIVEVYTTFHCLMLKDLGTVPKIRTVYMQQNSEWWDTTVIPCVAPYIQTKDVGRIFAWSYCCMPTSYFWHCHSYIFQHFNEMFLHLFHCLPTLWYTSTSVGKC